MATLLVRICCGGIALAG